jgi:putative hydrolase of the HAD superfamily
MVSSKKQLKYPDMTHVKAVLFDLGNTLYDKEQFVKQAFAESVKYLAQRRYLNYRDTYDMINRIWKIKTSHYEFIFDDLLHILGIYSAELLTQIQAVYHNFKPKLKPYPGVTALLKRLGRKYRLGLLTDGHPAMQRNKVSALGLAKSFDTIIYTAEHSPQYKKPNPFAYRLAMEKLKSTPDQTVYVGDNPYDDFKGARELGIFTVRALQGEFKNIRLDAASEADVSIKNIKELGKTLK